MLYYTKVFADIGTRMFDLIQLLLMLYLLCVLLYIYFFVYGNFEKEVFSRLNKLEARIFKVSQESEASMRSAHHKLKKMEYEIPLKERMILDQNHIQAEQDAEKIRELEKENMELKGKIQKT